MSIQYLDFHTGCSQLTKAKWKCHHMAAKDYIFKRTFIQVTHHLSSMDKQETNFCKSMHISLMVTKSKWPKHFSKFDASLSCDSGQNNV